MEQPQSIIGTSGESAALYCRAEGNGSIEYAWFHSVIGSDLEQISEFRKQSILYFTSLEECNFGTYTCKARIKDKEESVVLSEAVSIKSKEAAKSK